jgi:ankyrin repeat protein
MGILVPFEWDGQLHVLDVQEAATGRRLEDRTLREAAIESARETVPRYMAESRLRRGQGELTLTAIGYGEPYLVSKGSVKITKPDLRRLIEAARACDAETVRQELAAGNEPNARYPETEETALLAAVRCPDTHAVVVELLLSVGADPNHKDRIGWTPLMWAVSYGPADRPEIVKSLLSAGADVNARDGSRNTALMLAAAGNSAALAKSLLDAGVDVDLASVKPATVVKLLLGAGADASAKNQSGETALDLARRKNQTEIVQLLKKAGATE